MYMVTDALMRLIVTFLGSCHLFVTYCTINYYCNFQLKAFFNLYIEEGNEYLAHCAVFLLI